MKLNLILILALGLPACGAQQSPSEAAPAPSVAPVPTPDALLPLQGSFESDCKYMVKLTLKNAGSLSELIIHEYIDDACQKLKITTTLTRMASITPPTGDIYPVDITYDKATMVVEDAAYLTRNWFGITDWKVGEPRDVMGRSSSVATLPTAGQKYYQNWKYDGKALQIEHASWGLPAGEGQDEAHRSILLAAAVFTKV